MIRSMSKRIRKNRALNVDRHSSLQMRRAGRAHIAFVLAQNGAKLLRGPTITAQADFNTVEDVNGRLSMLCRIPVRRCYFLLDVIF
jgi:hypothetical protein